VGRRRALDGDGTARARVPEYQLGGMEVVAGIAGNRPGVGSRQAAGSVERIPHQRVSGGRQVNADLVRTAGGDPDVAQEGAFTDEEHSGAKVSSNLRTTGSLGPYVRLSPAANLAL